MRVGLNVAGSEPSVRDIWANSFGHDAEAVASRLSPAVLVRSFSENMIGWFSVNRE